ncbi:MAG: site-specific DNA-methyltransferase [Pontixanthobacter sp.]
MNDEKTRLIKDLRQFAACPVARLISKMMRLLVMALQPLQSFIVVGVEYVRQDNQNISIAPSDGLLPPGRRFEMVPLGKLKPDPKNPRKHSRHQIDELKRGFETLGFNTAITIDDDYNILAGHGRFEAACELGLASVPALILSDLTSAQRKAFVIADNKLGDMSSFDCELLLENLEEISVDDPNFDLTFTGFAAPELDAMANAKRTRTLNDLREELPAQLPKEVISCRGDVWQLGDHRLGCGDATDAEFVKEVIGSREVGLVLSDIPFNLPIAGVVSGLGKNKHQNFAMATGEMSRPEFVAFMQQANSAFLPHLRNGAMVLLFIDWRHVAEMLEAGAASKFDLKNILVWVKDNAGMGALWRSQHELICAFKHGSGKHRNNIQLGVHGRHRSNVLHYPGMNSPTAGRGKALELHATVKPVALIADLILDVSNPSDLVLDPFGGSGTTMIAAEATGRTAVLCEIDAGFTDVAVRRWQDLTNEQAILTATGETFDDVAKARSSENEQ